MKMERFINSKTEKQSIYEIFRACRLCGAGGGYKMPIIQNVVDFDGTDVELHQKIRECVQIEVYQGDKMPPLICELCVDKVNDFYEFLEMCRLTNKRTRLCLGLPPQAISREMDGGDCILGVTEPIYTNEDSNEPLSKQRIKPGKRNKFKKKVQTMPVVRIEKMESRESRFRSTASSGVKLILGNLKNSNKNSEDNVSLASLKTQNSERLVKPEAQKSTKGILKSEIKNLLATTEPQKRRLREKELLKPEVSIKRVKITEPPPRKSSLRSTNKLSFSLRKSIKSKTKPVATSSKQVTTTTKGTAATLKATDPTSKLTKTTSKSIDTASKPVLRGTKPVVTATKPAPTPTSTPPLLEKCHICEGYFQTVQARISHMARHKVTFTNPRLACNACGEWFTSMDLANIHHKRHQIRKKPYHCRHCNNDFKLYDNFTSHIMRQKCIPLEELPNLKCDECWQSFPTDNLKKQHECPGLDARVDGGNCTKCNRSYALWKNLKKHESTCTGPKKDNLNLKSETMKLLKPLIVLVARCDPLLKYMYDGHYDVGTVSHFYGLDTTRVYPYITSWSLRDTTELASTNFDPMVDIEHTDFTSSNYLNRDSEEYSNIDDISKSEDQLDSKQINRLSTLALKVIFAHKLAGKKRKNNETNESDSCLNTAGPGNTSTYMKAAITKNKDVDNHITDENVSKIQLDISNDNQKIDDELSSANNVIDGNDQIKNSSQLTGNVQLEGNENCTSTSDKIAEGNDTNKTGNINKDIVQNNQDDSTDLKENEIDSSQNVLKECFKNVHNGRYSDNDKLDKDKCNNDLETVTERIDEAVTNSKPNSASIDSNINEVLGKSDTKEVSLSNVEECLIHDSRKISEIKCKSEKIDNHSNISDNIDRDNCKILKNQSTNGPANEEHENVKDLSKQTVTETGDDKPMKDLDAHINENLVNDANVEKKSFKNEDVTFIGKDKSDYLDNISDEEMQFDP